jgi:hypothetical protein
LLVPRSSVANHLIAVGFARRRARFRRVTSARLRASSDAQRKSGLPDLRILTWPISGRPEIECARTYRVPALAARFARQRVVRRESAADIPNNTLMRDRADALELA